MAKKKPKVITKKQFDSWSPEKQQRALNDRRTRIRIEDKALPKEWLERRQRARWNRTPITPGSGTTYGDLEKQRKYLEPLTFGEGDRQLSDRTANLAGLQQASNDWFSEYRKQIGDANNAASQAAQATVQGGQNMITGITNQANIDRDLVARQLRDRAAQLGQVSSAPEFEQLANAARDTRAQQLASSNQAMNAGAAAASQEAASRVVSAGLADQANRDSNRRREIALEQDKKDYGSKKDAWRAKFIDDAIAEARKQVLEDRAFGATQADREADNARADKSLSIQERRLREQRRAARERERLAREREARQAAGGGGGGGGRDGRSSDRTRRAKRTEAFNAGVTGLSGAANFKPAAIVNRSRKGASRGAPVKGGADSTIRFVMTQYKVSREIAKRIVYAHIAYRGKVPSSVTWKNAPKTWQEAVKKGGY